jgi:hypothetical protein
MSVGGPHDPREPVGLPQWSSVYYFVLLESTKLVGSYWYCGFGAEVLHTHTHIYIYTHAREPDVAPLCVHRNLCVES